jgi:hypothetical protein
MKNKTPEWDTEEVKTPEHDEMILDIMNRWPGNSNDTYKILKIQTEVPVKAGYNKDFIVGYIDLLVDIMVVKTGTVRIMAIEVKPEVKNFGDLIRQINKYREYLKADDWVVETRKCKPEFIDALRSQNVIVHISKH